MTANNSRLIKLEKAPTFLLSNYAPVTQASVYLNFDRFNPRALLERSEETMSNPENCLFFTHFQTEYQTCLCLR